MILQCKIIIFSERRKLVIELKALDKRRLALLSDTFIKAMKERNHKYLSLKPFQFQNFKMEN